jgi:hypothetical protein
MSKRTKLTRAARASGWVEHGIAGNIDGTTKVVSGPAVAAGAWRAAAKAAGDRN